MRKDASREVFGKLLRQYAQRYSENSGKYANIIDLNLKLKNHQKTIYLEREKLLLKELKKSQEEAAEFRSKFRQSAEELGKLNALFHKTRESISKLKLASG